MLDLVPAMSAAVLEALALLNDLYLSEDHKQICICTCTM